MELEKNVTSNACQPIPLLYTDEYITRINCGIQLGTAGEPMFIRYNSGSNNCKIWKRKEKKITSKKGNFRNKMYKILSTKLT